MSVDSSIWRENDTCLIRETSDSFTSLDKTSIVIFIVLFDNGIDVTSLIALSSNIQQTISLTHGLLGFQRWNVLYLLVPLDNLPNKTLLKKFHLQFLRVL